MIWFLHILLFPLGLAIGFGPGLNIPILKY
jgi:hypothetical protein